MTTFKKIISDLKAIDASFSKALAAHAEESFDHIQMIAREFWLKPIKKVIDDNTETISSDIDTFQSLLIKAYKGYTSPLFTTYTKHLCSGLLKYEDFPYSVDPQAYKSFIQKLSKLKKITDIDKHIEAFRISTIDETQQYTYKKLFRRNHPATYILEKIEAVSNAAFSIKTERLLAGISPYIYYPQNKNTKETSFALALTAGISINQLIGIKTFKLKSEWEIEITSDEEKRTLLLLAPSSKWIKALRYLQSCELVADRQSSQSSLDIPEAMLDVRLSYKFLPALHSALCIYFHLPKGSEIETFKQEHSLNISSITRFELEGIRDLAAAYAQYEASTKKILDDRAILLSAGDQAKLKNLMSTLDKNPTFKPTVRELISSLQITQKQAIQLNKLLAEVYQPPIRRPTRKQKEAATDQ